METGRVGANDLGPEEAFRFTAKTSGTVEELQFQTNAPSGGVVVAVCTDDAGKPGEVLSAGMTSVKRPLDWTAVTGLSIPITRDTKYWLVALPANPE